MKLRIHDNSIRIRLLTNELQTLLRRETVKMSTHLLDREQKVEIRSGSGESLAHFHDHGLIIQISSPHLQALEAAEEGIEFSIDACQITIQKDLKCIGREDELNIGTFPNPKEENGAC